MGREGGGLQIQNLNLKKKNLANNLKNEYPHHHVSIFYLLLFYPPLTNLHHVGGN